MGRGHPLLTALRGCQEPWKAKERQPVLFRVAWGREVRQLPSAWQQALPACLPGGQGLRLSAVPILPSGILRPISPLPVSLRSHRLFLSVPTLSTLSQTVHLFLALGPFPEAYILLFVPNFVSLTSFTPLGCVCLDAPHVHTAPPLVVPHT